jgi:uncharacterized protein DUF3891
MIVRDEGATFLLITQPDHAQLAETIVAAILTEPPLEGPARRTTLFATREHDNGWMEVDAEPTIDPATGRPCDFMSGSARVKHELWLRGITRVAKTDPLAGALIAEHAVTVYGYRQREPEWVPFFGAIEAMRDALLERIGMFAGAPRETFEAEYRCVRLGDALSLQFCNAWAEPQTTLGYRASTNGAILLIHPDPFGGVSVPLRVIGRRVPARRYRHDADLRAAVAAATPEILAGEARGM